MATLELFGTLSCPYSAELREELEWQGLSFIEYDVEKDRAAFERMVEITGGGTTVPVLVEDGTVKQVGVQGRGCVIGLG